jgi:murein DD-endopeptidase MepM/ murein hydrolase activator NlpD
LEARRINCTVNDLLTARGITAGFGGAGGASEILTNLVKAMLPAMAVARLLMPMVLLLGGCAARVTAPPVQTGRGIYHVVRAGENLYRIGKAYDIDHQELARVNRLRDPNQIRVGQLIFVPRATRKLPVQIITPSDDPLQPLLEVPPRSLSPEAGQEKFSWPVSGAINSRFGPRGSSFHDGIDIAAPAGTAIHVIDAGEVIYSDHLRGYGNMVIVRHADDLLSVYAHNEANLVRVGQQVGRGEIIARVGTSGRVTGPHLHFEIRRYNRAEDPLIYMPRLCCAEAADGLGSGG